MLETILPSIHTCCSYTNHFLPTALVGCFTVANGLKWVHEMTQEKKLEPVDENTQKIFKKILKECNLQNSVVVCKRYENNSSPACVIGLNTIGIPQKIENQLLNGNPEQKLQFRNVIKHELGHLINNDNLKKLLLLIVLGTAFYTVDYLGKNFLPQPKDMLEIGLYSAASLVVTYLKMQALGETIFKRKRYEEIYADQFAIDHTQNPKELRATEKYFNDIFERYIEGLPVLYVGNKRILDEFDARSNQSQTLREWVIENRNKPYVASESVIHPNEFDRARTFAAAAERLEKQE